LIHIPVLLLQQLPRNALLAATHRESTLRSAQSRAEQAKYEQSIIHVWSPGAPDNEHTLANPKNQDTPIKSYILILIIIIIIKEFLKIKTFYKSIS
jgi:hypothetical protein